VCVFVQEISEVKAFVASHMPAVKAEASKLT
jgi:hypothetical protein